MTRLGLLFAGAVMLPSTIASNNPVSAGGRRIPGPSIGPKQRDILAACQKTAQRFGVFRDSTNITEYASDGEILMTWTMILPPETSIDDSMEQIAQQILSIPSIGSMPNPR